MKDFDIDKPFMTKDGRKAAQVAMCKNSDYPNVVRVSNNIDGEGEQWVWQYNNAGEPMGEEGYPRLANVPVKIKRWHNFYPHSGYVTKANADAAVGNDANRTACIAVEFEEGEGL